MGNDRQNNSRWVWRFLRAWSNSAKPVWAGVFIGWFWLR